MKTTFPCKSHSHWWVVVFVVLGFPRRCRRRGIAARTNEKTSVFYIWSYLRLSLRVPFRIGAEDGCVVSNDLKSREILTQNPKEGTGQSNPDLWTSCASRSATWLCFAREKKTLVRAAKAHDSILWLGDVYGNGSLSSEALTAMTDNTSATIFVHEAVS